MSSTTIKNKAEQILTEKTNKIIPSNIKKDVTIFDVTGSYEGELSPRYEFLGSSDKLTVDFRAIADILNANLTSAQKQAYVNNYNSGTDPIFSIVSGYYQEGSGPRTSTDMIIYNGGENFVLSGYNFNTDRETFLFMHAVFIEEKSCGPTFSDPMTAQEFIDILRVAGTHTFDVINSDFIYIYETPITGTFKLRGPTLNVDISINNQTYMDAIHF